MSLRNRRTKTDRPGGYAEGGYVQPPPLRDEHWVVLTGGEGPPPRLPRWTWKWCLITITFWLAAGVVGALWLSWPFVVMAVYGMAWYTLDAVVQYRARRRGWFGGYDEHGYRASIVTPGWQADLVMAAGYLVLAVLAHDRLWLALAASWILTAVLSVFNARRRSR